MHAKHADRGYLYDQPVHVICCVCIPRLVITCVVHCRSEHGTIGVFCVHLCLHPREIPSLPASITGRAMLANTVSGHSDRYNGTLGGRGSLCERPHVAIERTTDHIHLAGGSHTEPFGDTPRAGILRQNWPRPRTTDAERRARSRERNAPLPSRSPGPRRRVQTCSRARTRMSARHWRVPVRARTILGEFRAQVPRLRQ